jgi:predicted AlkP superfamily pyrophosphatase or phosphodiesterase
MKRLVLCALFVAACGSDSASSTSKHALVIGLDGVRVDALQQAATPHLDALIAEGTVSYDAFAGGVLGEETEQPTFSGPGWSSILTGVWTNRHGVQVNVFDDARFDEYPHFFARIREKNPDAYLSSFVTWGPINENILSSAEADAVFSANEADASAAGDVVVAGYGPDVPEYVDAVETVDAQIGEMVDAIDARSTHASEDWLVVVTTDHGGIGKGHGGQSEEERTIFMIASGGSVRPGQTVHPGPGHTAVPPTVMKHLGLEIDSAWGWESEPFGF